jgi:hypothetical protein
MQHNVGRFGAERDSRSIGALLLSDAFRATARFDQTILDARLLIGCATPFTRDCVTKKSDIAGVCVVFM